MSIFPKYLFIRGEICEDEQLNQILSEKKFELIVDFFNKRLNIDIYSSQMHYYNDNSNTKSLIIISTIDWDNFTANKISGNLIDDLRSFLI